MARWEPDSLGRLRAAAIELFEERGYAAVTAIAIAERAGVTSRTFHRYFDDKKDVLFGDEERLATIIGEVLAETPGSRVAEVVRAALTALAADMEPRRELLVRRARIVASAPELREREYAKVARWTVLLTADLIARGIEPLTAAVCAEAATSVFRVAFQHWVDGPEPLTALLDSGLKSLDALRPAL
jgi:AcrR family transcriptional regulator